MNESIDTCVERVAAEFERRGWHTMKNIEYANLYEKGTIPVLAFKQEYVAVVGERDELSKHDRHLRANTASTRKFYFDLQDNKDKASWVPSHYLQDRQNGGVVYGEQ